VDTEPPEEVEPPWVDASFEVEPPWVDASFEVEVSVVE